ncbi:phage major capsid protein [Pontibacillus litoralis]|uniref:Head protein n=1 Tax=Pontibacillus litoralis JSM 072002 TaxID=1385512 RepID=A0A0A5G4I3_9BACI|nr:phage major capsid protein [Pontibacillus litoralis]KGX88006.1 head protein [Pontibacillus litoralis JSM 072002]
MSKKMKLNLQFFGQQTFNPDNVMMSDSKDGVIPKEQGTLIMQDVMQNSKIMQLGVYEEMDKQEKTFDYFAEGPGAYWVNEGERIQTSKAKWLKITMTAKKLGVILPVSREYLQYSMSDFFEKMRPKISEAFYKKFDEAGILNINNPFSQSIEQSVTNAGHIVEGEITGSNILSMEDHLLESDFEANAFISKNQNATALRQATVGEGNLQQPIYDRSAKKIDGLPVVNLKSTSMKKGTLYTGDFDQLYYGIPFDISYKLAEEGTISTITDQDGNPINLFEREMVAMRATMDVAVMIVNDNAFAKLQPASQPEA